VLAFGFSGASIALEDAIVLGELLSGDLKVGDLRNRLEIFEQIRKPRAGHVRDTSRKIGRDELGHEEMLEYFTFLNGYDAVADARNHSTMQQV
jgi:salicylate hydroxylase